MKKEKEENEEVEKNEEEEKVEEDHDENGEEDIKRTITRLDTLVLRQKRKNIKKEN